MELKDIAAEIYCKLKTNLLKTNAERHFVSHLIRCFWTEHWFSKDNLIDQFLHYSNIV